MLFDIRGFAKKFTIPLISLASIALFLGLLLYLTSGEKLVRGVSIENVDVSGLSVSEANRKLADTIGEKYRDNRIILRYGDREWELGFDDINYRFMIEEAVKRAYDLSKPAGVLERFFRRIELTFRGQTLKVGVSFDRDRLAEILNSIRKEIDAPEANAAITYSKGKISFKHEVIGYSLDVEKNLNRIGNKLMNRDLGDLELLADKVLPSIRFDDIKEIGRVLSNFSTKFNSADINRSDNIRLACSRLNGLILTPGEEFSMNEALGERTVENGYKEAPVILKDELVVGTGGGVCQVTTTLYDTVLLARLNVLERSHHSMPLGYVKPSQDATIAEGSIDFKFENSRGYPIALSAEVRGDTIYLRILGKPYQDEPTVKLVSQVIAEYPPDEDEIQFDDTLPIGQKVVVRPARKGIRAVLYRDTYSKDGKLIDREKISEDYYKPAAGIVKINSSYYNQYLLLSEGSKNE